MLLLLKIFFSQNSERFLSRILYRPRRIDLDFKIFLLEKLLKSNTKIRRIWNIRFDI